MKVVFISNALTPHQIPFCDVLHNRLMGEFTFISTSPLSEERIKMGWGLYNRKYEVRQYQSEELKQIGAKIILEADVVLLGSSSDINIIERLKNQKITFRYTERLYKQGLSVKNFIHAVVSAYIHHGRFQNYPLYMLCASAYTAGDLAIFGNYKDRTYKWGYFPEVKEYDIENLMKSKRGEFVKILWVGRFIDLKHPEQVLSVARRLYKSNMNFRIKMIGNGAELSRIERMSNDMGLNHLVEFSGKKSSDEVRRYMEEANIYLFTSDFSEGWGAVLNESMNSGCAVVASHAIGSVPFLLKHRENGLIYINGNIEDLCSKVMLLAKNKELCEKLGRNAYLTVKNTWNANVAAERFLKLAEGLLSNEHIEFENGPCSRASIIKNNWF